jgi:hypothetical protein
MSSIRSFEDLECWKAAREIRIFVAEQRLYLNFQLMKNLP